MTRISIFNSDGNITATYETEGLNPVALYFIDVSGGYVYRETNLSNID